jgi:hypothetical protein
MLGICLEQCYHRIATAAMPRGCGGTVGVEESNAADTVEKVHMLQCSHSIGSSAYRVSTRENAFSQDNWSFIMASFITINAVAFKAFSIVASAIEGRNLQDQETLAAAGILPGDYRPFAIQYVATSSGIAPTMGQRGLTFVKDSAEDSRVKYLVSVLNGNAAHKAAARSLSAVSDLDKVLKAYNKLSAADKAAFKAAIK